MVAGHAFLQCFLHMTLPAPAIVEVNWEENTKNGVIEPRGRVALGYSHHQWDRVNRGRLLRGSRQVLMGVSMGGARGCQIKVE